MTSFETEETELLHYIICKEEHEDGEPHYHGYFEYSTELNTSNASVRLAVTGINPNIGKKPKGPARKRYLLGESEDKAVDEEPLTNYTEEELQVFREWEPKKLKGDVVYKKGLQLAYEEGEDAAMDYMKRMVPREFVLNKSKIRMAMREKAPMAKKPKLDKTPLHPEWFERWEPSEKTLWLLGPSGCGKTTEAVLWCERNERDYVIVCQKEDLKKVTGKTDVIIFDGYGVNGKFTRAEATALVDVAFERSVRVMYGSVTLHKTNARIFTSNDDMWPQDDYNAIGRRVHRVTLTVDHHDIVTHEIC